MKSTLKELENRGSHIAASTAKAASTHPEGTEGHPEAPEWLVGEARTIWDTHAPGWVAAGLLADVDHVVAAMLCSAIAEYLQALRTVETEGQTIEKDHYTGPHPLIKTANDARASALAIAKQMGITRVSRHGLVLTPPRKANAPVSLFTKG